MGENISDEYLSQVLRLSGLWKYKDRLTDLSLSFDSLSLSGGEIQRIGIARLLAHGCKILLLDEPFSGIDREYMRELISIIKNLSKYYTIVIVEHITEVIMNLSSNIVVMDKGKIVDSGSHKDLSGRCEPYRALVGAGEEK